MVVFSCNLCSEALKKNQVEKHYLTKCRNCEVVSCVDCGKDFWGDDYKQHIKCITEEAKYSGKNYTPRPGANKGEVKQENWIQQVQVAIDKNSSNYKLKNLLERLKEYPNIPRKKGKFENFLKNSLRIYDTMLAGQVWDVLLSEVPKKKPDEEKSSSSGEKTPVVPPGLSQPSEDIPPVEQTHDVKLSKRERKEERRNKHDKKEKKDRKLESVENEDKPQQNGHSDKDDKSRKGKKKRKHDETEISAAVSDGGLKAKKRKGSKHDTDGEDEAVDNSLGQEPSEEEDEINPTSKKQKISFNWEEVILEVLSSKSMKSEKEISLKKLKKKVLCEYASRGGTAKSEEKLWAKFDKKVKKNPRFRVLKDKVKLVER